MIYGSMWGENLSKYVYNVSKINNEYYLAKKLRMLEHKSTIWLEAILIFVLVYWKILKSITRKVIFDDYILKESFCF